MLFYLFAYTVATMGAFAVVVTAGARPGERGQQIDDSRDSGRCGPWLAAAMAVFMLSLLGFPRGGMGFSAKWYVLQAALERRRRNVLAVVLVLTSVVSAGYYLAVVMAMYMRPRPEATAGAGAPRGSVAVIVTVRCRMLVFGVRPGPRRRSRPRQFTGARIPPSDSGRGRPGSATSAA